LQSICGAGCGCVGGRAEQFQLAFGSNQRTDVEGRQLFEAVAKCAQRRFAAFAGNFNPVVDLAGKCGIGGGFDGGLCVLAWRKACQDQNAAGRFLGGNEFDSPCLDNRGRDPKSVVGTKRAVDIVSGRSVFAFAASPGSGPLTVTKRPSTMTSALALSGFTTSLDRARISCSIAGAL
jgi:hypothetical protein